LLFYRQSNLMDMIIFRMNSTTLKTHQIFMNKMAFDEVESNEYRTSRNN
jgi:hypothetical protein